MTKLNVAGVTFSEDEINELKAGGTASKVLSNTSEGVTSSKPAINVVQVEQAFDGNWGVAPKINGGQKVSKPRVRGQEDAGIVRAPNMAANNSTHAAEMLRLEEEKAAQEAEQVELRAFMDPAKLRAEIEYLTRTVKRLERSLKSLKKDHE